MRFVAIKTPEQQSVMMLHRVRLMVNRQRTQLSMRAHVSESHAGHHKRSSG
jgi:transposase